MSKRKNFFGLIVSACAAQVSYAQSSMDEVHLFDNFFQDAIVSQGAYGEAVSVYSDDDDGSTFASGVRGGVPISSRSEIGFNLGFAYVDEDNEDSESGLLDPSVVFRHNLDIASSTSSVAVGGTVSLPIGEEKIGQDEFELSGFLAARHQLVPTFTLTGSMELKSVELGAKDDREFTLNLGVGSIYQMSDVLHIIGEWELGSKTDEMTLLGGVDYKVSSNARIRGAVELGVDDGSDDLALQGGLLYHF